MGDLTLRLRQVYCGDRIITETGWNHKHPMVSQEEDFLQMKAPEALENRDVYNDNSWRRLLMRLEYLKLWKFRRFISWPHCQEREAWGETSPPSHIQLTKCQSYECNMSDQIGVQVLCSISSICMSLIRSQNLVFWLNQGQPILKCMFQDLWEYSMVSRLDG